MEDSSLIIPDCLTPSQFVDLRRSANGDDAPTKKLMRAVLERALMDIIDPFAQPGRRKKKRAASTALRKQRRAASAIDWIFDDGGDGVFSFVNVCDVLGVDAERLRERVWGRLGGPRMRTSSPLVYNSAS